MAVTYSVNAINARLSGVVTAIGTAGLLKLYDGSNTLLAAVNLANPCGTVSGGALTFTVPVFSNPATGTGTAVTGTITDSTGAIQVSGLSVGIPLSGANILITNGNNNTLISAGQTVELLSGQIIGS